MSRKEEHWIKLHYREKKGEAEKTLLVSPDIVDSLFKSDSLLYLSYCFGKNPERELVWVEPYVKKAFEPVKYSDGSVLVYQATREESEKGYWEREAIFKRNMDRILEEFSKK